MSWPNSPGWGMTLNFHLCSPVRASYARMSPGTFSIRACRYPLLVGVPHDHYAVDDDRGRGIRDVADLGRDPLLHVVGMPEVGQQINCSRLRKAIDGHAYAPVLEGAPGLGIERVKE